MCIVIDVNTFSHVFNPKSSKHHQFKPVCDWVIDGEGHVVYGGTKYKKELKQAHKYTRLFRILKDARRAFEIDETKVDNEHTLLEAKTRGTDCNDQHIIAIFIVSGCRLFCSVDKNADKHIKEKALYPKGHHRPSIYRNRKHVHLLNSRNIIKLRNIS